MEQQPDAHAIVSLDHQALEAASGDELTGYLARLKEEQQRYNAEHGQQVSPAGGVMVSSMPDYALDLAKKIDSRIKEIEELAQKRTEA